MQALSDQVLVDLSLKGDKAAFAELVTRYQKQIYSLTYNLTNNSDDAQDMAQEVFLKLYRVLDKYDPDKPFFSWMYKVATNVCYTHLRKTKKNNSEFISTDSSEFIFDVSLAVDGPEGTVERNETREIVQKALAELPENYKIPLVLRYIEDLSYKEIAAALDVPVTTIETRLFRGKSMLQKRLSVFLKGG